MAMMLQGGFHQILLFQGTACLSQMIASIIYIPDLSSTRQLREEGGSGALEVQCTHWLLGRHSPLSLHHLSGTTVTPTSSLNSASLLLPLPVSPMPASAKCSENVAMWQEQRPWHQCQGLPRPHVKCGVCYLSL